MIQKYFSAHLMSDKNSQRGYLIFLLRDNRNTSFFCLVPSCLHFCDDAASPSMFPLHTPICIVCKCHSFVPSSCGKRFSNFSNFFTIYNITCKLFKLLYVYQKTYQEEMSWMLFESRESVEKKQWQLTGHDFHDFSCLWRVWKDSMIFFSWYSVNLEWFLDTMVLVVLVPI